jgi:hypothetical protein
MNDLPKNWDALSLAALWNNLNDPHRHATPQSTIEAVLHSVRTRGIPALEQPGNKERLSRCDAAARRKIDERITKLRERELLP